jgi:hypothetical protein
MHVQIRRHVYIAWCIPAVSRHVPDKIVCSC